MPSVMDRDFRDQAWKYFKFHASQRLTTFNFYIAISALLTSGLFALYQDKTQHLVVELDVGALLFILSVIFLMLDKRNQALIGLAESALIAYEEKCKFPKSADGEPNVRAIFSRELYKGENDPRPTLFWIRTWHYRYSNCFGAVFFSFGTVALAGMVLSVWRLDILADISW